MFKGGKQMEFTQFKGSEEYVVSKELTDAVNIAMALEKPLLIKASPAQVKPCSRRPSRTHSAWTL